ncbi:butyrophilin-like protein 10 isoform X2 [Tachysurus vachellii]|uniref:butyrophilin-like protein 10 isoform X2 n=1 Tax=Tachysurus vachellii TaxID=175792 RepID=UPI00296AFD4D|nr:butyrophilin-like protein 10 isoform X2 [Tachysurus vachellii]
MLLNSDIFIYHFKPVLIMFVTVDERYFYVFAFLLLINNVLVQSVHVVNGTQGRSVILPCSTSDVKTNVYWRYNDSTTVCDIINGKADFEEQHVKYKGRVETFQTEFPKGNFSIKLNNLTMFDAGMYTCNFPRTLIPVASYLKVTENGSESLVRRSDSLLICLLGYMLLSN